MYASIPIKLALKVNVRLCAGFNPPAIRSAFPSLFPGRLLDPQTYASRITIGAPCFCADGVHSYTFSSQPALSDLCHDTTGPLEGYTLTKERSTIDKLLPIQE